MSKHQAKTAPVATATGPVNEGIFDRFKFWEGIKVYEDITVGDLEKALAAAKSKDPALIRAAIIDMAGKGGYQMDADEINDIVTEVVAHDLGGIVYECGDYAKKFAVIHLGYIPPTLPAPQDGDAHHPVRMLAAINDPVETFGAKKRFDAMTGEEAKTWLNDRRADLREGAKNKILGRWLKDAPEIVSAMAGNKQANAISPERLEQLYQIALKAKKIAGWLAMVPPLTMYMVPVVAALTFFCTWYETHYGAMKTAGVSLGLSLDDIAA